MKLYPKPKDFKFTKNVHPIKKINFLDETKFGERLNFHFDKIKKKIENNNGIILTVNIEPHEIINDGYEIKKHKNKLIIYGGSEVSIYYAILTLNQMFDYSMILDQCVLPESFEIKDYPSFQNRGFMLDISRDRVPNLKTVYNLIEILSTLKINEMQLYTEHTFRYSQHPKVSKNSSAYDSKDIKKIENYCDLHYIELIPNQQTLGHMSRWTSVYPELAEDPTQEIKDTFDMDGDPGFSLAANNKSVHKLMDGLIKELSLTFNSKNINVGLDETWDLCSVSTKEDCENFSKMDVYLSYLNKIKSIANKYNFKKIQFWADMIQKESVEWLRKNIPSNAIPMLWGYDEDSTYIREYSHKFRELKKPYYVCPSTNSWNSFTGRYLACINNIHESATLGFKNNATGFLLTDWGDNGHTNALIFSYFGIVCGACMAWNHNYSKDEIKENSLEYLDKFIFEINISDILWKLGTACNYNDMYLPGLSILFHILVFEGEGPMFVLGIGSETFSGIKKIINSQLRKTEKIEDILLKKEITLGCRFLMLATNIGYLLTSKGNFIVKDLEGKDKMIINRRLKKIIEDYKTVWNSTSRVGGLSDSIKRFNNLIKQLA